MGRRRSRGDRAPKGARREARLSLGTKFAALSALAFALLGWLLAQNVMNSVTRRHMSSATHAAELVATLGIKPMFDPKDFRQGMTPDEIRRIDRQLSGSLLGGEVVRIKVWNADSTIVYSDDRKLIGQTFAPTLDLADALKGELEVEVSSADEAENAGELGLGKLLEVYVPFTYGKSTDPLGAFELYLPYTPIQGAIDRDVQSLQLRLVIGLIALYMILFRIVTRASRRLRQQAHELRQRADENEFLALHDPLTDLPNRRLFHDRVQQAVLSARRDGSSVALLVLDLDRFKEVNDTLGHHNGDLLLKAITDRLKDTLRDYDSIARLGGDEFAILIPDAEDRVDVMEVATRVHRALATPFRIQDLSLDVSASSGIAVYPDHGTNADELLQRADVAMYVAKSSNEEVAIYDPLQDSNSASRLVLLGELRHAIENGGLLLHYQPKIDVASGRAVGVEALVRWKHPEQGLIPPDVFIGLAEETGLIKPLTQWVLDAALSQFQDWRSRGLELGMAVNLSVRNLLDLGLPYDVAALLEKWDVPAERLTLEITESGMMADTSRTMEILHVLHSMGVGLSIDDFGTGHSSLAYLKQLPVNEIKIDKSFVMDMRSDRSGLVIVRSTIDLGHNLDMRVVAEGVENSETQQELASLGCDLVQGFHFSMPLPAHEMEEWVRARYGPERAVSLPS